MSNTNHPFWVIVNKEISDYVRSWRFIILIVIIALTCMGSLYTALTNIREAIKPNDPDGAFLFLQRNRNPAGHSALPRTGRLQAPISLGRSKS